VFTPASSTQASRSGRLNLKAGGLRNHLNPVIRLDNVERSPHFGVTARWPRSYWGSPPTCAGSAHRSTRSRSWSAVGEAPAAAIDLDHCLRTGLQHVRYEVRETGIAAIVRIGIGLADSRNIEFCPSGENAVRSERRPAAPGAARSPPAPTRRTAAGSPERHPGKTWYR